MFKREDKILFSDNLVLVWSPKPVLHKDKLILKNP